MNFHRYEIILCHHTWNNMFIKFLLLALLVLTLSGCSMKITPSAVPTDTTTQPGNTMTAVGLLPDSHLKLDTVHQLFALSGDYLLRDGSTETIFFNCMIVEGTFCWFAEEDLGGALYGKISKDLARIIIMEIDPKVIEQSKSNEIKVRCNKPVDSDKPITCEGNWGWTENWDPIEVR